MFIVFDAQCRKCHKSFKAEVDGGSYSPVECRSYICTCPCCKKTVIIRGGQGTTTDAPTLWAVSAQASQRTEPT